MTNTSSRVSVEMIEIEPTQLDPEKARITEFSNIIDNLTGVEQLDYYIDFDSDRPIDDAIKRFVTYDDTKKPVLLFDPSLGDFDGYKGGVKFSPRTTRGGKKSNHGVFFGDLGLENDRVISVAVKPHEYNAKTSCLQDFYNNAAIKKMAIESLQPVGILLTNENIAYSLTVLDESLQTFDGIDWSDFYPNLVENPGMVEMWDQVARQAALLHSIGSIAHNDLATRNIACTTYGAVFFIDWEKSSVSATTPRDAEVRYSYSRADLSCLLESMCRPMHDNFKSGVGIFYNKPDDWWQGFRDIVFDQYCSDRLEYASQGSHHSQTLADVKDELMALKQSLKEDVVMYKKICDDIPLPAVGS